MSWLSIKGGGALIQDLDPTNNYKGQRRGQQWREDRKYDTELERSCFAQEGTVAQTLELTFVNTSNAGNISYKSRKEKMVGSFLSQKQPAAPNHPLPTTERSAFFRYHRCTFPWCFRMWSYTKEIPSHPDGSLEGALRELGRNLSTQKYSSCLFKCQKAHGHFFTQIK